MSQQSLLKSSFSLALLTIISRVLGLVREQIKAGFLGTTSLSDAFSVAFLIPNLLRRLFAEGTMSAAFIPTFKGYLAKGDKKETAQFLSSVFTFAITIFIVVVLIGMATSGILVDIFAPKLEEANMAKEAVFLTRIMFPYLAFISIAALIQGVLNSVGIFGPSGFTPILFNLSFIVFAFLLTRFIDPARAISIGVVVGGITQMLFQIPFMLKTAHRFKFTNLKKAFTHPGVKKVCKLVTPTLFGMGAYQINIIITTRIANNAGEGIVSSLQFSNRIQELVLGIFIISLSTVILPELTGNARQEDWETFNKNLFFGIKLVAMISIPAMIFMLLMRKEMVSLLFGFGKFGGRSIELTSYALAFHISGLFFIAVTRILFPVFYAQEDTVSPTVAGVVALIVNVTLAYLLAGTMKGGGVALAATISAFASLVVLLFALKKKRKIDMSKIWKSFFYSGKFLIISICCCLPPYFLKGKIYSFFSAFSSSHVVVNKIIACAPFGIVLVIFGALLIGILFLIKDETAYFVAKKILLIKRKNRVKTDNH